MVRHADLGKRSVLIQVLFPGLLGLLRDVREVVDGDAVDWEIWNGQTVEEEAGHRAGVVHVGVLKEALLAGLLALLGGGRAAVAAAAAQAGVEAGGLAVERRQAGVDAAGQSRVGGLAGERLDPNLQRDALGHVGDGENVLRRRLGKLPDQVLVGSANPV